MRSRASKASSSGIWMSRNTRSGRSWRIASTASRPFWQVPTSLRSGTASINFTSFSRAYGSSSTTMTRITASSSLLIGDADARGPAVAGQQLRREDVVRAVDGGEPLAHVAQADTHLAVGAHALGLGAEIVTYLQHQGVAIAVRGHGHVVAAAGARDAVLDGILDQGLEYQAGHPGA